VGGGAIKQTAPDGVEVVAPNAPKVPKVGNLQTGKLKEPKASDDSWPVSDLRRLSGRVGDVRRKADGFPNIRKTLPPEIADKAEVIMLYRVVCAHDFVSGAIATDRAKHHDGNGVYVAYTVEPPVVYLTCATGAPLHRIVSSKGPDGVKHCNVINRECRVVDGIVEPVEEVVAWLVHWVALDKEELHKLIQKGEEWHSRT